MPNTSGSDRSSLLLSQALQRDVAPVMAQTWPTGMSLIIHHGPSAIPAVREKPCPLQSLPGAALQPDITRSLIPPRDRRREASLVQKGERRVNLSRSLLSVPLANHCPAFNKHSACQAQTMQLMSTANRIPQHPAGSEAGFGPVVTPLRSYWPWCSGLEGGLARCDVEV